MSAEATRSRYIQPQLFKSTPSSEIHQGTETRQLRSPETVFNGIPGSTYSQRAKYFEASEEVVESRKNGLTIYQPYLYDISAEKNGVTVEHQVASRYARIPTGEGREAWFEILGTLNRDSIAHLSYLMQPQLHLILRDINSQDVIKLVNYLDDPREDSALVRLVSTSETPLLTGIQRETDAIKLQQAGELLGKELLGDRFQPDVYSPSHSAIQASLIEQEAFEELFVSANHVRIGKPQIIEATLDNSHSRTLYVYPTISSDGVRSSLISNKDFSSEDHQLESKEIIGRTDFLCGCQKFGERALDHTCGHELLGSLKGIITPNDRTGQEHDPIIIIAWGGIDANGNGSVMHSIKPTNQADIDARDNKQDDQQQLQKLDAFYKIPLTDHRAFRQLAEVLWAAGQIVGADTIRFNTANAAKIRALQRENENMTILDGDNIHIIPDPRAIDVIPQFIRDREDRGPIRRFSSIN